MEEPSGTEEPVETTGEGVLPLDRRPTDAMRLMLTVLTTLAILYTMALCDTLMVPLVLAVFLGLGLNPLVGYAARVHIPRAVAAVMIMILVGAGTIGAVVVLVPPAAQWVQKVPAALQDLASNLRPLTRKLDAASEATQSLVGGEPKNTVPVSTPASFGAWDVIKLTPGVAAFTLTVGLLAFFFLVYGDRLLLKLVEVSPSFASKRHSVGIVRGIQIQISRYLFTAISINVCLGAITAAYLWALGMPNPLLWGSFATLANFVPYVGAIITGVVLILAGSIHFQAFPQMLFPVLGFTVLSVTEGNFVTPLILGRRLLLSPVAILVSLILWGWLWGVAGALLAVPILTCAKLTAESIRGWEWFAILVSR